MEEGKRAEGENFYFFSYAIYESRFFRCALRRFDVSWFAAEHLTECSLL